MNLLAIGSTIHFLSIEGHPGAEAMIPQGDMFLLNVHSPHTTTPNPGSKLQQQFQSTNCWITERGDESVIA